MNNKFAINEVCNVHGVVEDGTVIKSECTVMGYNMIRSTFYYAVSINGYHNPVDPQGYGHYYAMEIALFKKKPPKKLATWEEVQKNTNWNPTKVEETLNER